MAPTVEQSSSQDPSREGRHVGPDAGKRIERLEPAEWLNLVDTPDGPKIVDGEVLTDTRSTGNIIIFGSEQDEDGPGRRKLVAFEDVDPQTGEVTCCLFDRASDTRTRFTRVTGDGSIVEQSEEPTSSVRGKVLAWSTSRVRFGQARSVDLTPRTVAVIDAEEKLAAYERSLAIAPDGMPYNFDGAEPRDVTKYLDKQPSRSNLVALERLEGEAHEATGILSRVLHAVATAQARKLAGEGVATDSPAFAEAYRRAYEGVVSGSAELRGASDEFSEARKSRMGREALAQIFRGSRAA